MVSSASPARPRRCAHLLVPATLPVRPSIAYAPVRAACRPACGGACALAVPRKLHRAPPPPRVLASVALARVARRSRRVEQVSQAMQSHSGAQTDMLLADERGWREESERAEPTAAQARSRQPSADPAPRSLRLYAHL